MIQSYGKPKKYAALLCVALLLISSCVILLLADHTCVGEDCPICAQFAASVSLFCGSAFAILTALHAGRMRIFSAGVPRRHAPAPNPVQLHVKALN